MNWDIVLFNSKQKINSVAKLDKTQLESTDFSEILESSLNRINEKDNHREIDGTDFTVDFFADSVKSSNFMPSLCGENGIYALIELEKKHNWQIYYSEIDGMVDLENPEKNGFKKHRKYFEQIMNCKS